MSARCKCGAPVEEPARCLNGHAQVSADPLNRLADLVADRLADRIAERLDRIAAGFAAVSVTEPAGLVDANEIARVTGMSPRWVYDHADVLGVIRAGNGDRPRLRFDPVLVRARMEQHNVGGSPAPPSPATPQRIPAAELLPVKDRAA
jgi:hypothetical protein